MSLRATTRTPLSACVLGVVAVVAGAFASQTGPALGAPHSCQATAFLAIAAPDRAISIDLQTDAQVGNDITLPPGSTPSDTALTPDGATLFVVLTGSAAVAAIDVASRTVTDTIAVGTSPQYVAITPDGSQALVTNYDAGSVSTIDIATRTKHPTDIPVGTGPSNIEVTPDGTTAYVSNTAADTVSTIDIATRTKHPTDIPVGTNPTGIAFTPDGSIAFVTNRNGNVPMPDPAKSGTVSRINVATRTTLADIAGFEMPAGVAISPDGATAWITNYGGGLVSSIDIASGTKAPADLPVASGPYDIAVSPDGTEVFAVALDGAAVSVIDPVTRSVTKQIDLIGPAGGPSFTPCASPPPTTTTTIPPTSTTTATTTTTQPPVAPVAVAASPRFTG